MSSEDLIAEPSGTWSTLVEVLRARANECSERVVCTFAADNEDTETHLAYGELDARARAIATLISERNVARSPVLLLYAPGLEYIAGFFGCLYAGALAVPAYPPLNARQATRLQRIAKDAGARLVLSTAPIIQRARLFAEELEWLATDEVDVGAASSWRDPGINAQDLAFLQYTSGSTAAPKGVMLAHRNLMHNLRCIGRLFRLRPGSVSVSWLPPYHDMGLIGQILEPIFHGVHTYLMSPAAFLQSPMRWLRTISRTRAEVSGGPNFAYELCARKATPADLEKLDLSCWRVAFNGAEPIRAETLEAFAEQFGPCGFRREAFYPCYGMAEGTLLLSGGDATALPVVEAFDSELLRSRKAVLASERARRLVSSGRAAPEHRIRIVDPESTLPCVDGCVGEVWVSGPSVAGGYWRRADLTQQTFMASTSDGDSGPYLRTGDLGFVREGELFVVGRLKDLIILRGRNLYAEDIELSISRCHSDVRLGSGAAFAAEISGEERLIIAQEIARRPGSSPEAIVHAIRRAVAEEHSAEVYAVVLLHVGTIPKTSSGKIQRHACREAFASGSLREVSRWSLADSHGARPDGLTEVVPTGESDASEASPAKPGVSKARISAWLSAWVARRAGVAAGSIGEGEPFAGYGLGSVDVVQLSADLERWLGRKLSPVLPYQYPTIGDLAGHLARDSMPVGRSRPPQVMAQEREPIAIVGLSCRFPGAPSPEAYWRLLCEAEDAVSVRPDRWTTAAAPDSAMVRNLPAGFLEEVGTFDADFFGISPREATQLDPQQRLLLEVAWEALERAGAASVRSEARRTGVFIGISTSDYAQLMVRSGATLGMYAGTGTALSMAANRLSYQLDLRGPSIAIDTACSSSLVAVHLAVRSLRRGECDAALAGGVNLLLSPDPTLVFSRAQMMAKGGRCRTFDAAADGYVRGEGCGVLVLKRLSDALASRDQILAVIRGSAMNQDGRSNGLTAPNGLAQQAVIREALADAGLEARDIDYIEAHGTGTPLGDPIEVDALKAVLLPNRPVERRCAIGSVKTNIGHLEAAAGVAGLIKAVLAIQQGQVPAHLHLEQPNPAISLDGTPLFIPRETRTWPDTASPRRAGVSSFGFGGTNCHLVIEQAPVSTTREVLDDGQTYLLALSARSERALATLAGAFGDALRAEPELSAADVCYSANAGRPHHDFRIAVTATSNAELAAALNGFAAGAAAEAIQFGRVRSRARRPLAALFTGQGSQYPGMARELFEKEPRFRRELEQCEAILRPYLEEPLLSVVYGDKAALLDQTAYTQPALFAVEWSLFTLWRSWGIEPSAVMGHSVGEYVAACVAGVFGLPDALRLIAERGRLMQALPAGGLMAALRCDEESAERAVRQSDGEVAIAAINGRDEVVISGSGDAVKRLCAELDRRGVPARLLNVSHAFHSPLMEPMLDAFEAVARQVTYRAPDLELISNLTGRAAGSDVASASYWRRHVREPVRFSQGLAALRAAGYATFIEMGPAPVLTGLAKQDAGDDETFVSSLSRKKNDCRQMFEGLGRLYAGGASVDWRGIDAGRDRRAVVLPTYPFERSHFWFSPGSTRRTAQPLHLLLGQKLSLPNSQQVRFESAIEPESLTFLQQHQVFDEAVLPAAAYLEMALAGAVTLAHALPLRLEGVVIRRAMVLSRGEGREVQSVFERRGSQQASAGFEIYSRVGREQKAAEDGWVLNVKGSIASVERSERETIDLASVIARCEASLAPSELYRRYQERGLAYGPEFQAIEELRVGKEEALGKIRLPESFATGANGVENDYQVHPVVLDGCLQVIGAIYRDESNGDTWLPVALDSLELYARPGDFLLSYVSVKEDADRGERIADIRLLEPDGRVVGRLAGLHLRRVARERVIGEDASINDWFYRVEWRSRSRRGRQLPAGYVRRPAAICERLTPDLNALADAHVSALKDYPTAFAELEGLAFAFAARALSDLGWQPSKGERFSLTGFAERFGVLSRYRRLLSRIFEMLAEEGVLARDGDEWSVADVGVSGTHDELALRARRAKEMFPHAAHELELLERTSTPLARVLQGRCEALNLLFPDGDFTTVTAIYQDTAGAQVLNRTAAAAVRRAIEALPATRTLRVLEIGAGTGATTSHLLPILPREQTDYVFTDVSPMFMASAKGKFRDYPFVEFTTLDIEKDPLQQGQAVGAYDLIVASNVLHATRDLAQSVRHLRELLAPGGLLLLSEGTTRVRWLDLTFGLVEGWWRFADTELRPDYPLLDESKWRTLLLASGFEEVANAAAGHARGTSLAPTAVLLARAGTPTSVDESQLNGSWILYSELAEGSAAPRALKLAEDVASLLRGQGKRPILVKSEGEGVLASVFDELRSEAALLEGIVVLSANPEAGGVESSAPHDSGWPAALQAVQALSGANLPAAPSVWLVTHGATPAGGRMAASGVWQAPLWGVGRTLQLEHPELRCHLVDLDTMGSSSASDLVDELLACDAENQIAFREGRRYVARLARAHEAGAVQDGAPFRLEITERGVLSALALEPLERAKPKPGQVEIEIRATGLNFRDVLNAMGLYPGDPGPLGCDTAGIISAVGEGVEEFRVGDAVVAIAAGTFSSHVTIEADFVAHKPKNLSFEEAATLPVVFVTAYYALVHCAGVGVGNHVLIHAASGGVGQAAIQLARRAGAYVHATASPSKWKLLEELGVASCSSSRSLDFADAVRSATGGRGVDAVLNCLTGEFIAKSLSALVERGCFVEIGKVGIWSPEQVRSLRPDVGYSMVDLPELCRRERAVIRDVLEGLMRDFEHGTLKPIPCRVYPLSEVREAYRAMQRAEHVGKLVITMPQYHEEETGVSGQASFRADASYLITGGLGDLGLLVARWMAERGARHFVLVSRHECNAEDITRIRDIEELGAQVTTAAADVSNEEQLARVISAIDAARPLRGVVHAAGLLEDGLLRQQGPARFRRVLAPKMLGAWHLHRLTSGSQLDFFVLFASVAGVFGSSGQANHAAANAFLDGFAHYRRSLGLPAVSIDWGIWSELGAAARKGADTQVRMKAMGSIEPQRGLEALEQVFSRRHFRNCEQIAIVPIAWQHFQDQARTVPFLSDFGRAAGEKSIAQDTALLKRIRESPLSERRAILEERLCAQVAQVLGWRPERVVDPKQGFFDTGMDSLTSLELRNLIQRSLGCELPSTVAFDYPTIEALAGYLLDELPALKVIPDGTREEVTPDTGEAIASSPADGVSAHSQSDLRQMLDQQLASIEALLVDPFEKARP